VRLVALRDLPEGEELTVSYGRMSNALLVMDYGFVEPNNPYDRVTITFDHKIAGEAFRTIGLDDRRIVPGRFDSLPCPHRRPLLKQLYLLPTDIDKAIKEGERDKEREAMAMAQQSDASATATATSRGREKDVILVKEEGNTTIRETTYADAPKERRREPAGERGAAAAAAGNAAAGNATEAPHIYRPRVHLGGDILVDKRLLAAVRVLLSSGDELEGRSLRELAEWATPLSSTNEMVTLKALVALIGLVEYADFDTSLEDDLRSLASGRIPTGHTDWGTEDYVSVTPALDVTLRYRVERKRLLQRVREGLQRRLADVKHRYVTGQRALRSAG